MEAVPGRLGRARRGGRIRAPAAAALIALAACDPIGWLPEPPAPEVVPQVDVSVRVVEYPVEGATEQEWRASMRETTRLVFPERPEGQPLGLSSPDLDLGYTPRAHPNGCAIADVRVALEVTEFVPVQEPEGWLGTSEAYRDFARHVRSHEDGHKDIDVRWAHALAAELAAIPVQPDCDALRAATEAAYDRTFADRNAAQAAYHEGDLHPHRR